MSCHCLLAVITPSTLTCVSTDTICDWRSKCVDTHYQRKTVIGQEILSLNANKSILIATLRYSNSYLTVSASSVVHHVFACEGHKISAVSCDGTFALWLVSWSMLSLIKWNISVVPHTLVHVIYACVRDNNGNGKSIKGRRVSSVDVLIESRCGHSFSKICIIDPPCMFDDPRFYARWT
jgi:hypothetical protein